MFNMKKYGRALLMALATCAVCGCLALTGCGGSGGSNGGTTGGTVDSGAREDAPKSQAAQEDPYLAVIDGCEALYKGAQIAEDSDGNPAIVLTFDFTNNSEKSESFFWSMLPLVYQDGVELNMTFVYSNPETYERVSDNDTTNIKPGTTIEVSEAYALTSTTSPVSIEFEDIWTDYKKEIEVDLADATPFEPKA